MRSSIPQRVAALDERDELQAFTDSMTELQWLLLILVMLYFHIPTRPIDSPEKLVAVMVAFAGFVLVLRFLRCYPRETRWKLTVQTLGMTAFITLVLWCTGKTHSPLLNLYLLVIIACAITLGRTMTVLHVALVAACYLFMGYAVYGIAIISAGTFSTLMANFSPFLLVAYVTSLLAEDIRKAKRRIMVLSQTDELTGLLNMRAFNNLLDKEIVMARRYPQPFTLMMIDVDGLKKVNDQFGHAAGTHMLMSIAASISGCVRTADVLARYGGDEFIILMPHTHSETARIAAERIRTAVHRSSFELSGQPIAASVSIGIASFPESSEAAEDVMEKADAALYRSKQSGRDTVSVYHDGTQTRKQHAAAVTNVIPPPLHRHSATS